MSGSRIRPGICECENKHELHFEKTRKLDPEVFCMLDSDGNAGEAEKEIIDEKIEKFYLDILSPSNWELAWVKHNSSKST